MKEYAFGVESTFGIISVRKMIFGLWDKSGGGQKSIRTSNETEMEMKTSKSDDNEAIYIIVRQP